MVALRHVFNKQPQRMVHFYDGPLIAHDGVLEVPANRLDWVKRAWLLGYNKSAVDDSPLFNWSSVLSEINRQGDAPDALAGNVVRGFSPA